ncbi:MAG: hypothetical protein GY822_24800 [Deltaproteobacteria bacterium]|nr:hypothetical protein [Deltaproteobacteria bacterium]
MFLPSIVALALLSVVSTACSNAETPGAYYLTDAGIDLTGTKDYPCRIDDRCDDGLVCTEVTEGNRCKYECFLTSDAGTTDCPVGTCRLFTGSDTNGACVE